MRLLARTRQGPKTRLRNVAHHEGPSTHSATNISLGRATTPTAIPLGTSCLRPVRSVHCITVEPSSARHKLGKAPKLHDLMGHFARHRFASPALRSARATLMPRRKPFWRAHSQLAPHFALGRLHDLYALPRRGAPKVVPTKIIQPNRPQSALLATLASLHGGAPPSTSLAQLQGSLHGSDTDRHNKPTCLLHGRPAPWIPA